MIALSSFVGFTSDSESSLRLRQTTYKTLGVKTSSFAHENARPRTVLPASLILLSFSQYLD